MKRVIAIGVVIALSITLQFPSPHWGEGQGEGVALAAELRPRAEQINTLRPHPQSTPNNTVYVEPGIVSVADNAKVEYDGGNSPAFAVVTADSRIDLLTINTSGTLEVTQGTQAASPTAPTYPTDKLVIAEITVDETATVVINDADIKDVRFFLSVGGAGGVGGESQWTDAGVYINANNATSVVVADTGNVGIGTTAPAAPLDVLSTSSKIAIFDHANGKVDIGQWGGLYAYGGASDTKYAQFYWDNGPDGNMELFAAGSSAVRLKTDGSDSYILNGNVGIGTTGPEHLLELEATNPVLKIQGATNDATGSKIRLTETSDFQGAFLHYDGDDNVLNIGVHDSIDETLGNDENAISILRHNGNVGIGTTGPTAKLEVGGASSTISNASGDITINAASNTISFSGDNLTNIGNLTVGGALSKGSGSFDIPHPDPAKEAENWRLRHYFVESPTRGDNIYRWVIKVEEGEASIELPDYFAHLNENVQVWVSPVKHFGRGYGEANAELTMIDLVVDTDGIYNILAIGTRKDKVAKEGFAPFGIEYQEGSVGEKGQ